MKEGGNEIVMPSMVSTPFWEGCKRNELLIPRCMDCGNLFFYPRPFCPHCLSTNLEWVKSCGRGYVYTFSVIEKAPKEQLREKAPYVLALINLKEGVVMMSNIERCDSGDVYIEMEVEVFFDHVTDEISLPKFMPVRGSGAYVFTK